MVCGEAINDMFVPALLNTQAVGITCLAVLVKAPASDGKSALFIQVYLSVVFEKVCLGALLHMLNPEEFFLWQ
jgi:hypothetical protein